MLASAPSMPSFRQLGLTFALASTFWCESLAAEEAAPAPPPANAPAEPSPPANAPVEPPASEPLPPPELRTGEREVLDYDGRGTAYDRSGSPLLWVPRVILFPLYVVSEYVVRRPLGWATVKAERSNLANLLVDWFTFGPDRQAGLVPTASSTSASSRASVSTSSGIAPLRTRTRCAFTPPCGVLIGCA